MFHINSKNEKEFTKGKNDWKDAVLAANDCQNFKIDVEDEVIADELRSCYNCRYRRWTFSAFVCCK